MKRSLLIATVLITLSAGAAFAQEFRTTPRVAPEPIPPRPPAEQDSNSDFVKKLRQAPNKFQLFNPFAPQRYGSGAQVVTTDPRDPQQKPRYWRLFSIAF
jgi:hypothetical protein